MHYQLKLILSEEDYLAFNQFHSLQSPFGKKMVRKSQIFFVCAMVVLTALIFLVFGRTIFAMAYAGVMALFTVVYLLLFKKIVRRSIKAQIKHMKSASKLPYDPESTLEFYEDALVEMAAGKRLEQSYDVLERICIWGEDYIFLYSSSVNAYILPMAQVKEQVDAEAFLNFLSQKCKTVERCSQ